jgi:hypothetical protein
LTAKVFKNQNGTVRLVYKQAMPVGRYKVCVGTWRILFGRVWPAKTLNNKITERKLQLRLDCEEERHDFNPTETLASAKECRGSRGQSWVNVDALAWLESLAIAQVIIFIRVYPDEV